jgi:hypothetical protein
MISTKFFIKIAFFNLILKLVKIINFLIKKWKNEIFSKILKNWHFYKNLNKIFSF